ncbi:hypothetical protein ACFY5D_15405 [Paeniglutamicibacter sp. NPDC012692]|uniref:hypothetical protein n=1 Tax=Paeniglutamicibacter sp. NPDC012692 TaxID=3364388 RepID=UPI0036779293
MLNKKLLLWALGVIVFMVGATVAFNLAARSPSPVSAADGVAAASQGPAANEANAADGVSPDPGALPSSSTAADGSAAAPTKTDKPSAGGPSASAIEKPRLEVPASPKASVATLPKSVERAPAILGKAPKEGTANGKLTPGFPTSALPIPEGAHIVDSSVGTQKRNVQAAANYRTSMSPEKVLAFYESASAKQGWLATRGTAADGASNITIGYGKDTVVATVRTAATGATFVAVFGSFVVGE